MVVVFRILVVLFLVRQFWHSFLGGIACCLLLVSPIALYMALVAADAPVEMDLFRQMAKTTWDLLFAKPFHYMDMVMNVGVAMEKMLQV